MKLWVTDEKFVITPFSSIVTGKMFQSDRVPNYLDTVIDGY